MVLSSTFEVCLTFLRALRSWFHTEYLGFTEHLISFHFICKEHNEILVSTRETQSPNTLCPMYISQLFMECGVRNDVIVLFHVIYTHKHSLYSFIYANFSSIIQAIHPSILDAIIFIHPSYQ